MNKVGAAERLPPSYYLMYRELKGIRKITAAMAFRDNILVYTIDKCTLMAYTVSRIK